MMLLATDAASIWLTFPMLAGFCALARLTTSLLRDREVVVKLFVFELDLFPIDADSSSIVAIESSSL